MPCMRCKQVDAAALPYMVGAFVGDPHPVRANLCPECRDAVARKAIVDAAPRE